MNELFTFSSPIGIIEITCSSGGISRVFLGASGMVSVPDSGPTAILKEASRQLEEYFTGSRKVFDLPLDWSSLSGFQRKVLELTEEIPYGDVLTYGELARKLGNSAASRAVGAALGRNPMPILIPCHRVVAADGRLTGYSAAEGIKTKAWLLSLEGRKVVGQKLE